jgi:hypothetical protein
MTRPVMVLDAPRGTSAGVAEALIGRYSVRAGAAAGVSRSASSAAAMLVTALVRAAARLIGAG